MTQKDNQLVVQGISSGEVTADPQSIGAGGTLQNAVTSQLNTDYRADFSNLSTGNGLIMTSGCQTECLQVAGTNNALVTKTDFSMDWGFGLLFVGVILVIVFAKRVLTN